MRRRLKALFVLAVVLTFPVQLRASSCLDIPPRQELEKASLVFVGRVADVTLATNGLGFQEVFIEWEVLQAWSSEVPRRVVTTPSNGRWQPELGRILVIFGFADRHRSTCFTFDCSNNTDIGCARTVLEALGPPRTIHEAIPDFALRMMEIAPCNCFDRAPDSSDSTEVTPFVGRVVEVTTTDEPYIAAVTWEVIRAWTTNVPRFITAHMFQPPGDDCGELRAGRLWGDRTIAGRVALVRVARFESGEFYVPSCFRIEPLACLDQLPAELGKPAISRGAMPKPGSNSDPLDCWVKCVDQGGPIQSLWRYMAEVLTRGVSLRDVSFVEWTDGTIHDLQFSLQCAPAEPDLCTEELANQFRAVITAARSSIPRPSTAVRSPTSSGLNTFRISGGAGCRRSSRIGRKRQCSRGGIMRRRPRRGESLRFRGGVGGLVRGTETKVFFPVARPCRHIWPDRQD